MEKLDLTKKYKAYYTAKSRPEVIEAGQAFFLSITGKGDPSGKEFANKVSALYATAYSIKFMYKEWGKDFLVAKLEGLWSFDEQQYNNLSMTEAPAKIPRSEWMYRLLIRLPDFVTPEHLTKAVDIVVTKKQVLLAKEVEYFSMNEGKVVQILHKGPFATEAASLLKIEKFMIENGFGKNGLHHEIYLSDFRRTAPEKLKTILREPVK